MSLFRSIQDSVNKSYLELASGAFVDPTKEVVDAPSSGEVIRTTTALTDAEADRAAIQQLTTLLAIARTALHPSEANQLMASGDPASWFRQRLMQTLPTVLKGGTSAVTASGVGIGGIADRVTRMKLSVILDTLRSIATSSSVQCIYPPCEPLPPQGSNTPPKTGQEPIQSKQIETSQGAATQSKPVLSLTSLPVLVGLGGAAALAVYALVWRR